MYLVESRNFTICYGIRGGRPEGSAEKLYAIHQDMWSNSHLSRTPAGIVPANLDCLEYRAADLVDGFAANAVSTHDFVRETDWDVQAWVTERVADVSSVTDAVYPDPEVFSLVFEDIPLGD